MTKVRIPLSKKEKQDRRPPSPSVLVQAEHDRPLAQSKVKVRRGTSAKIRS